MVILINKIILEGHHFCSGHGLTQELISFCLKKAIDFVLSFIFYNYSLLFHSQGVYHSKSPKQDVFTQLQGWIHACFES